MFGDYRVQVWNENLQSELDTEYFCRGYESALLTAIQVRTLPGFAALDVYYRDGDKFELVDSLDQNRLEDKLEPTNEETNNQ